ncbi:MAG: VCBS repeat-containing protein [Pedosphaera sp.]|nr:VCBS repeat-containing protein [Pedosphaera sp.]
MKTSIKNPFLFHRPVSSPRSSSFQAIRRCATVFMAAIAVMSSASAATVAFGDFNHDGLMDRAAITSPTTITVSLANPDGSYTVSAILKAPSNQPMRDINVRDTKADGNLDILGVGYVNR